MSTQATPPLNDPAQNWNERFAAPGLLFGAEPNSWLREHAAVWSPGERILCVADGEGRNSVWLAEKGLSVEAFDIAEIGVAKARALAAQRGVTVKFSVADCDGYAWPEATCDGGQLSLCSLPIRPSANDFSHALCALFALEDD